MNIFKNFLFPFSVCCWLFASGTVGFMLLKSRVSNFALSLSVKVTASAQFSKCEFATFEIGTSEDAKIDDSDIKKLERDALEFAIQRFNLSDAQNLSARMIIKEGFHGDLTGGAIEEIVVSSSTPVVCRAALTVDQRISRLEADRSKREAERNAEMLVYILQDISATLKLYDKKGLDSGTSVVFKEVKEMRNGRAHFMGNYRKAGEGDNPLSRAYREEIALRLLKELQKAERAELLKSILTRFVGPVTPDYDSAEDFNVTGAIAACVDALQDSIRTRTATASAADHDELAKQKPGLVRQLNFFFGPVLQMFDLRSVEELPPV
jgi:hypothetical protein